MVMNKAQQLVGVLLENDIDDPSDNIARFSAEKAAARDREVNARWSYVKSKHFNDGSERSRLYQNIKSGIYLKLLKNFTNDTSTNVYVYDEKGDFIDGAIGEVHAIDLSAALAEADLLAQNMVKDYSITVYRKSFM